MPEPIISKDPLFLLLSNENVETFNKARALGKTGDLTKCSFRGLDLRGMNAEGLDFTDAYFRGANLRGIDFRGCNLEGASFADAQISGCYFPSQISAQEILMSVTYGTRIRYDK